ncbi:MAG: beta strand repeat-containing protein, partial [Bacteroidales bacterium]
MKKKLLIAISILFVLFEFAQAQTTKTVGATGANYSTLKLAFDAINAGTIQGQIILQIIDNTTETATATLNASGMGSASYSSVIIYPTVSGKSITGNLTLPIIYFLGADNVTIDGRLNAVGFTKDLTITNNSTATGAVIVRYVNSAEFNTIKYCTLKASPNSVGTGILYFTNSDFGNGNNNNIVEYCDITCNSSGRPRNAVFTSGTSGRENKYNIIRNNNFYDVFSPSAYSYTINISNSSSDWTISNNSFYETTTLVPANDNKYFYIYINTGNNHLVSNNYFGGTEPECAGSPLTINSSFVHYYAAIFINGGLTNKSIVSNNIIRNMNYTSTNSNPWDGIYINSGNVDVTGNTIGAETGTGSIIITTPVASATAIVSGGEVTAINIVGGGSGYTVPPTITFSTAGSTIPAIATANLTGGVVTSITLNSGGAGYTSVPSVSFDGALYSTSHGMIQNSSGTVNISNNKTGSITTVGSSTYSHGFESIYVRTLNTSATTTITNNLYGSLTTPNSIYTSSSAANSIVKQDVYGIYSSSVGTTIITGNTIANLTNGDQGTNSGSKTRGIQTISGSNTIQNNIVRNLSASSGSNGKKVSASVIGISQSSSTAGTIQIVSNNTVYAISNTNATAKTSAIGMYYSGPTTGSHLVNGNFIHTINASSSDIGSEINGLVIFNGMITVSNNIINIGGGITTGYLINGIWDEGNAASNNSLYFNTVYIDGAVSSGATSNTAALWNNFNGATRNYRNNLLVNNRSVGSGGKHFSIFLAGTANTSIDYNDYFCPNGVLGKISANERSTLALWKTATNQDSNSVNISPGFINAGGNTIEDYYISALLAGVSGTGITTDYAGLGRGAIPKMGALEANNYTWQGSISSDFATATNWAGGVVPTDGADITFAANPDRNCVLDQNRTLKNITNAQSTDKLVLNGKKLTLTGNLNFEGGAQIDGTAANSHIVFQGMAAQNILAGSFVNNTIDTLSINNVNGFTLNGDFTIEKGIALNAGNFNIGPNTLTFNGEVTAMNGSVTGGTSTNMIIGGTGSTISMPPFTLNNLTINRENGVTMYGDLNITNVLTLTNGTLSVGTNTLTLAKTPIRTSGSINASDPVARVIFSNLSAITLPASIFSAAVNNLVLTGAGGITSPSDFAVNGELNLAASNPSATKGLLDMLDGLTMKTLTMGANATTVGAGDVTGIVTRNSFISNTPYSFGNQFTTINMAAGGTLPSSMSVKIVLTSDHTWKPEAIHRYYDIIQTGGTSLTKIITNLHYLDTELNGATVGNLDLFDYHITATIPHLDDHGRSNDNTTEKWVGLANMSLTYIARPAFDNKYWTLGTSTASNFTWLGAVGSTWENTANWVGGVVPGSGNHVIIPDASTTPSDPELPSTTTIGYLQINNGGILNGGEGTVLTIDGGYLEGGSVASWDNMGTFNAGTSTVIFTSPTASISDPTNFYNVTIAENAKLTLGTGNVMRIAGELTLAGTGLTLGVLNAANTNNTIEFNGANQTIINTNGSPAGYYNLILSGSGTKTMPSNTALTILNDFTITGTASATSASTMTVAGDVNITENASWNTGDFNHFLRGDFFNFGTFTATSGKSITFEGIDNQINSGGNATDFTNLILNNEEHLNLFNNININEELTLTAGNIIVNGYTLGINGTISRTTGHIEVSPLSSLSFGGTGAIVLNNDLFSNTPTINNLTINRSEGVTLGNQSMAVNGLLDLQAGTLSLAANKLTIAGSSPTKGSSTGFIDASNASSTLSFTNSEAIILPESIFTGNVNNLTINGVGGVTASSDFTINGILHLQSENPSATKGVLDMWDGVVLKTLSMGANATTVGLGDVTGIIRRTTFSHNTAYTFGNQYSFITFDNGGILPTEVLFKVNIGMAPSWKPNAILRSYDLVRTGGIGCTASLSAHYLDSELNGISEEHLVLWNFTAPSTTIEYGSTTHSIIENWTTINYINFQFFPTSFGEKGQTLGSSELASNVWDGSDNTSWDDFHNWVGNSVPNNNSNVIIPDASTTLYSPTLVSSTEIKTLSLESNAVLSVSGSSILTINGANGAWSNNGGNFNPGSGNVTFTNTAATISGITSFNNLSINNSSTLWMTLGSTIRVAGAVTNNGTWRTVINGITTVEYNGESQTVVVPNPATNRYSTLILSGTGIKTMPSTALEIVGDFYMAGTAIATAAAEMAFDGNVTLGSGTSFTSGSLIHTIKGNFMNNGATLNSAGSTFNFNGTTMQTIGGTIASTFNNLTLNNSNGMYISDADVNINGELTFNAGVLNTLTNKVIIANGGSVSGASNTTGHIYGNLQKNISTGTSIARRFEIGGDSIANYEPIDIMFNSVSNAGNLIASSIMGDHTNIATSTFDPTHTVNRIWTLTNSGIVFTDYDAAFNWVSSDQDAGFDFSKAYIGNYSSSTWSYPNMSTLTSSSSKITGATVFGDFQIGDKKVNLSGNFMYYNLASSSLGNSVTVGLYSDANCTQLVTKTSSNNTQTTNSGEYHFNDLYSDTYYIKATSSILTNGAVNGTDAAQINSWGINPYSIEKVRFFAGDVKDGGSFFINASDASLILQHFVNAINFDRNKWTFWKTADTIANQSSNPTESYPSVTLAVGSDKTANMYGLCTGDFNRSYYPNLIKSSSSSLNLINTANMQVSSNEEFDLLLRVMGQYSIAASSLVLNFPADLVEIQDVVMNTLEGILQWSVNGNELRIGWYSSTPINL